MPEDPSGTERDDEKERDGQTPEPPRDRWLELLLDVALISNSAESIDEGLSAALARVCEYNGWYAGYARSPLRQRELWWLEPDDPVAASGLPAETRELARRWAEQVMGGGETQLIADFSAPSEATFDLPGEMPESGAAIATPLLVGAKVVGAAVFFSRHSLDEEPGAEHLPALLPVIDSIGTQLGRILERWSLVRRIAEEGEKEREALGRQVHDGLAQQLVGAKLLADNLRHLESGASASPEEGPHAEQWDLLVAALDDALAQARALARGLSEDLVSANSDTLVVQLEELAETTETAHGVECALRVEGPISLQDDMSRTQLMRIAREAVYNALRHADAARIDLRLVAREDLLALEVRDDGSGLPENVERSDGMGLASMRYRAGLIGARLEIESEPEAGTLVRCAIRID